MEITSALIPWYYITLKLVSALFAEEKPVLLASSGVSLDQSVQVYLRTFALSKADQLNSDLG